MFNSTIVGRCPAMPMSEPGPLTDLGAVKVDVRSAPMSRHSGLACHFQKVPVNRLVAQHPALSYK